MGNSKKLIDNHQFNTLFVQFLMNFYISDKKGSTYFDVRRQSSKNEISKRETEIKRSQNILRLEQAILEHRGRILRLQDDLNDVRRNLNDVRERLTELSE